MIQFILACVAAGLATLGGREAVRAARLGVAIGPARPLTLAIALSASVSSGLIAWLGWWLMLSLPPVDRQILTAAALLLAAAGIGLLRAGPAPREPTRSFGALLLVLLAAMIADPARLVLLAIVLAMGGPWLAASGAALGSGIVLLLARAAGRCWEDRVPARPLRHLLAASLLIAGFWMAWQWA